MKKNKNFYKIILDIIMTMVLIVLMKITFTGMLWHEILGLGVFSLFIIHKFMNIKIAAHLTAKFKKLSAYSKSMLLLDILLFIDFLIVVGTGILISQELFASAFAVSDPLLISAIHHSSATIGLILVSVHIGLHWPCVMSIIKNKLHLKNASRLRTALSRIVAVAIMLLGVQSSYSQNVFATVTEPLSAIDTSLNTASDSEDIMVGTSTDNASDTVTANSVAATDENITLEEYLSSLYCTACPKHCPLSSPQCSKGTAQAQEATADYYALYGDSSTTDTPSAEEDTADEHADSEENNSDEGASHQNGKRRSQEESTDRSEQENEDNTDTVQDDNAVEFIPTAAANLPAENALDYISIMGLYVGGTHYLVKIPRKKK
jgi:hypothetical protein